MAELWTPPGADLGYNMPGGEAPPETPSGQPGPPRPGGFWGKVKAGLSSTLEDRQQQNAAKTPDERWGGTTKPQTKTFLQSFDPPDKPGQTEGRWAATKWAFRGQRTTDVKSEYSKQLLYGGVQARGVEGDRLPTRDMTLWGQGVETPQQARSERRMEVMNEQEMYPPGSSGGAGGSGAPQGMPPGTGADPVTMAAAAGAAAGRPDMVSADPMFARNVGQVPYNQMQFGNIHAQKTAGPK